MRLTRLCIPGPAYSESGYRYPGYYRVPHTPSPGTGTRVPRVPGNTGVQGLVPRARSPRKTVPGNNTGYILHTLPRQRSHGSTSFNGKLGKRRTPGRNSYRVNSESDVGKRRRSLNSESDVGSEAQPSYR
eukprot:1471566-Rhodomonas_salina.1